MNAVIKHFFKNLRRFYHSTIIHTYSFEAQSGLSYGIVSGIIHDHLLMKKNC